MSEPSFTLTGSAVVGVIPPAPSAVLRNALFALPTVVKLGRKPSAPPPHVPHLRAFLPDTLGAPIPPRVDWFTKARASVSRIYLNDRYGDCVIAGKAHTLGAWSAEDTDSGGEVQADDSEILNQYRAWCGPGDNGCYIPQVLDGMTRQGFKAGGKAHALAGYCAVDWHNTDQLKTACYLFGPVTIGFNLPSAWMNSSVWDVTTSGIAGGHDVSIMGYDERGVIVASWGRLYLMTWKAVADGRYIDECYALLGEDWYGTNKVTSAGVKVDELRAALAQLAAGNTPPIPGPVPPPVPPPAPAPGPTIYDVAGTIAPGTLVGSRSFVGVATPRPATTYPDEVEIEVANPDAFDAVRHCLDVLPGLHCEYAGQVLRVRRGKLTPAQWQVLLKAIMSFVAALIPIFAGG